jgi:hypothetical protein
MRRKTFFYHDCMIDKLRMRVRRKTFDNTMWKWNGRYGRTMWWVSIERKIKYV